MSNWQWANAQVICNLHSHLELPIAIKKEPPQKRTPFTAKRKTAYNAGHGTWMSWY